MFLLEISNEQIIFALVSVISTLSVTFVAVTKKGWEWLKGQFDYLTSRIENLEAKMDDERSRLEQKLDSERKYLSKKLDDERKEQDDRIDGLFEKVLSKMKTEKIDIQKIDLGRKQNG